MKRYYKCNRCGKILEIGMVSEVETKTKGIIRILMDGLYHDRHNDSFYNISIEPEILYELCPDCFQELKNFMNESEVSK